MRYHFLFHGRLKGAIGINYLHRMEVEAPSYAEAQLKLYETHEHISIRRYFVEHDGVTYRPLPSQGAYYGVSRWQGRDYLVCLAMRADGSPAIEDGAVQVSNFDERQDLLDEVNQLLGTQFPMSAFPGR